MFFRKSCAKSQQFCSGLYVRVVYNTSSVINVMSIERVTQIPEKLQIPNIVT